MPKQPLGEVFGFPINNFTPTATHYRSNRLCPFNNKVPNCTKDKAENPLGVCSVNTGNGLAITCPVRFRQDWLIASDAAAFFFPHPTKWTSLVEVPIYEKSGQSAGNIDVVLVAYDNQGRIVDFGGLEVQAVYISGNIRRPFEYYIEDPVDRANMDWAGQKNYPNPDYLSSSRKRLAPQLLFKGGILKIWNRKMAVALHTGFYNRLPTLPEVDAEQADIAWLIYDIVFDATQSRYNLIKTKTVYTSFEAALVKITQPEVGEIDDFIGQLQTRLDRKLTPPNSTTLIDLELT